MPSAPSFQDLLDARLRVYAEMAPSALQRYPNHGADLDPGGPASRYDVIEDPLEGGHVGEYPDHPVPRCGGL